MQTAAYPRDAAHAPRTHAPAPQAGAVGATVSQPVPQGRLRACKSAGLRILMFCKRIPRGHLGAIGPEHSSELEESGIGGRDPANRCHPAPKQCAAPSAAPGRHPEPQPRGDGLRRRLRAACTGVHEWLIQRFANGLYNDPQSPTFPETARDPRAGRWLLLLQDLQRQRQGQPRGMSFAHPQGCPPA